MFRITYFGKLNQVHYWKERIRNYSSITYEGKFYYYYKTETCG